jgi:hypothetical protein
VATISTFRKILVRTVVSGVVAGVYSVLLIFLFVFLAGSEALNLHPWLVPLLGLGPGLFLVALFTVVFSVMPTYTLMKGTAAEKGYNLKKTLALIWVLPLYPVVFTALIFRTVEGGVGAVVSGLLGAIVALIFWVLYSRRGAKGVSSAFKTAGQASLRVRRHRAHS